MLLKRFLAAAFLLGTACLLAWAQTSPTSTRAMQEFAKALTDAGNFGVPRYPTASLPACNSANSGFFALDTTIGVPKFCDGTTTYPLPFVLFTSTADATVTNTVDEFTIIGTGVGTKTTAANLLKAGRTIRITVQGFLTNTATPTLDVQLKAGTTILLSTGPRTMATITGTRSFALTAIVTCRTSGVTGLIHSQGEFRYGTNVTAEATEDAVDAFNVLMDTTVALALDVVVAWGTAAAANSITGTNAVIEILN